MSNFESVSNITKGLLPGLYHFNCHCRELPISMPCIDDIELIITDGKFEWLFKDNMGWIRAMGYKDNETIIEVLIKLIKQAYCYGLYVTRKHDKYGALICM